MELLSDAGTLIIIDCGTGAHELGQNLVREGKPVRGHMLISHTHWDHIQGIPFFAPFFVPGNEWDIYAPQGFGESLRDTLTGQMEYTYFPVTPEAFGATLRYNNLGEGHFKIGDVSIWTQYLNHPALTIGFRIEADGASVVYSCDHEPHSRLLASGEGVIEGQDLRHAEFLRDADLVIHDAQYLACEYAGKAGWGHSTVEYALQVAQFAGVKRLALTHHDPNRDDDQVDAMLEGIKANLNGAEIPEVFAASEGQVIELSGERQEASAVDGAANAANAVLQGNARGTATLLLASDDDALAGKIAQAIEMEPVQMCRARTAEEAIALGESRHPALVIVDDSIEGSTGIDLAAKLGARDSELPALIVSDREAPGDGATGGSIDWLQAPFSVEYARSRVRTWMMRSDFQWVRASTPDNERARISALQSLGIMDTPREEAFDRHTRIAAALFDVPVSLVSFVDDERQWFKSCFGTDVCETSRDMSFCAHAIAADDMLVVPDTLRDHRFRDNPMVSDGPRIRFYAGVPLRTVDGLCLGTLCILDFRPRSLSEQELAHLRDMARLVEDVLRHWKPGEFQSAGVVEAS